LALFREEREVEIFEERVLRFGEIPNVSLFCERLLKEAIHEFRDF
jgi:predicted Zn-dependent protease